MKKIIYVIVILILIVVTIISLDLYISQRKKHQIHDAYHTNWVISLPSDALELYYNENDHWFGEGDRYTIFFSKNKPVISDRKDRTEEKNDRLLGDDFLQKLFQELSIDDQLQLRLNTQDWKLYRESDGSRLLIANQGCGIYIIAEELF